MKVKVLLFGSFAEQAGNSVIWVDNLDSTDALKKKMAGMINGLESSGYIIALNQEVIRSNHTLSDGDEVALMPPFAGG